MTEPSRSIPKHRKKKSYFIPQSYNHEGSTSKSRSDFKCFIYVDYMLDFTLYRL